MAYIKPESFPVRTRSPQKRSPEKAPPAFASAAPIANSPPSRRGVNEQSYEFQKNAAIFHGSDSRLNSPSLQQMQFEANAARFHGGTPNPSQTPAQGSAYDRNKANFYAVTPEQTAPQGEMSRSYRKNQEKFFGATPPESCEICRRGSGGSFNRAAENFFE